MKLCTLVHGSRIIFAEGSDGCQLVSAEASLNLIGAYRGSRWSPRNEPKEWTDIVPLPRLAKHIQGNHWELQHSPHKSTEGNQAWCNKENITFKSVDEIRSYDHSNESHKEYFPVVLFITLYKVVPTFEPAGEILKCDHSNESYRALHSCGSASYAMQLYLTFICVPNDNFEKKKKKKKKKTGTNLRQATSSLSSTLPYFMLHLILGDC